MFALIQHHIFECGYTFYNSLKEAVQNQTPTSSKSVNKRENIPTKNVRKDRHKSCVGLHKIKHSKALNIHSAFTP